MASLLPHQLLDLSSFVVESVLSDGTDGGSVNLLGHVKEEDTKKLIVKVFQKPLSADNISLVLQSTALESRAPYSGAEYGYYSGRPSPTACGEAPLAVDIICPDALPDDKTSAADKAKLLAKLVQRNTSQVNRLVRETPTLYAAAHDPYIASIPSSSLLWLYKILNKEKEVERLIIDDPDPEVGFQLNVDSKWNSHPSCSDTPRVDWKNHPSVKRLYCLGICHRRDIRSLRDLRGDHVPLLKNMKERGLQAIRDVYGLAPDQVRVFVHYPPQFYHMHVHFTALSVEGAGVFTERSHLLDDVVDRLVENPMYYARCNLTVRGGEEDPLLKALFAAEEKKEATVGEGCGSAGAKAARTA